MVGSLLSMRLLLLAVVLLACSCQTPEPKSKQAVDAFLVKVENRWPPDIGKQLAEEWGKDHPTHIVFGDKASDHVTLIVLEGEPLSPEDKQRFTARVRELDCREGQSSAK